VDSVATTKSARKTSRRIRFLATTCPLFVLALFYVSELVWGSYWLDSSELAAAGFSLGIPHPPGHPLYVVLAKFFTWLPLGPVGLKVSLLSGLMGLLCCYFLSRLLIKLSHELFPHQESSSVALSWMGIGAFGLSTAVWLQSVRPEVYTLQTALNLGIMWSLVLSLDSKNEPKRRTSYFLMAVFLLGLGGLNHHYLALFMVPGGLYALILHSKSPGIDLFSLVKRSVFYGTIPLMGYLLLPIRASQNPYINWVDPETWSRFLDVILARVFHASVVDTEGVNWLWNAAQAIFLFMEQTSPLLLPLVLLGGALLWRKKKEVLFLLSLLMGGNILSTAIMEFDRLNPDTWGYLQLSLSIWIVLAVLGLGWCITAGLQQVKLPPVAKMATFMIFMGLFWGWQWQQSHQRSGLSGFDAAERFEDEALQALPPSSLHMSSFFSLFFNHWYAQVVDGRRPDLIILSQSFDQKIHGGVPYIRELRERSGSWRPVFDSFLETGKVPIGLITTMAAFMPVFFEAESPSAYETPIVPRGVIQQVCTSCDSSRGQLPSSQFYGNLHEVSHTNPETRTVMVWHHFHSASLYKRAGQTTPFTTEIEWGRLLAPRSRHWDALEAKSSEE